MISQAATLALSTSSCAIMHHNVLNAFNSSSPVTFEPVTIAQVYPAVIRLPATGAPVALSPEKFWRSISLNLHRDISSDPALRTAAGSSADQSAQLWWQIEISDSIIANEQGAGMVFYVTSARVAPSYLTGGIGSYSVMAVYVTVRACWAVAARRSCVLTRRAASVRLGRARRWAPSSERPRQPHAPHQL